MPIIYYSALFITLLKLRYGLDVILYIYYKKKNLRSQVTDCVHWYWPLSWAEIRNDLCGRGLGRSVDDHS